MTLFVLIAPVLLIIANWLVYLLAVTFFEAQKMGRLLTAIVLIGSSFGFLFSLYLIRSFDNFTVRFLYISFSLTMGLLFYLTISAVLFQLGVIAGLPFSKLNMSKIGVILAVVLLFIGVFDASFSKIRNISVNMAGLSSDWQGKKIVQISDIHLGGIYGPRFLERQVAKVNFLEPDLIVITGDLFDGSDGRLNDYGPALAKLHAKEGVVFIPGNHDTYLGLDKVEPILKNAGIIFLRDEAINIKNLEIIGLDFAKFSGDTNGRSIKNLDPNFKGARLLLNHVPTDIQFAKELNVNLQLSGHSHRGQMFPLSLMTWVIYGKYQYGLHTEGNFNIYTSSGLGSWGPPVRTFNQAEIVNITLK